MLQENTQEDKEVIGSMSGSQEELGEVDITDMTRIEEMWSVQKTAKFFGVTDKFIYDHIRNGNLTAIKIGTLNRIPLSSIRKFMNTQRNKILTKVNK